MSTHSNLRGFERILTTEVHISDLLQELTDRDPTPWEHFIGMVPTSSHREYPFARLSEFNGEQGIIDLLLEGSDVKKVAIEVKFAHDFSDDQRVRYEALNGVKLLLLGMASDKSLVESQDQWSFHSLADVFEAWEESYDESARLLAKIAADSMKRWDKVVDSVFRPTNTSAKLDTLEQKFVATLVSRRLKHDLIELGRLSRSLRQGGNSGLPVVQGFAAINGDEDRCLIAEARWLEGLHMINFRLGIDFSDLEETEATRSEAWNLAKEMDDAIHIAAFKTYLEEARPDLKDCITFRGGGGRSTPNDGIWGPIVKNGIEKGRRRPGSSGFVGDGALIFEASGQIQSVQVDAVDLRDLIDEALKYLGTCLPVGYTIRTALLEP